jgi:uncharacterized membrane protein
MAKVFVFLVGLVAGVVVAQRLSGTPAGRRVLTAVNDTTGEFRRTVADSYRAHRAETGTP